MHDSSRSDHRTVAATLQARGCSGEVPEQEKVACVYADKWLIWRRVTPRQCDDFVGSDAGVKVMLMELELLERCVSLPGYAM